MYKFTPDDRVDILSQAAASVRYALPAGEGNVEAHVDAVLEAARKYEAYVSAEPLPRVSEMEKNHIMADYGPFRQAVLSGKIPVDENASNLMNHLDKLLGL